MPYLVFFDFYFSKWYFIFTRCYCTPFSLDVVLALFFLFIIFMEHWYFMSTLVWLIQPGDGTIGTRHHLCYLVCATALPCLYNIYIYIYIITLYTASDPDYGCFITLRHRRYFIMQYDLRSTFHVCFFIEKLMFEKTLKSKVFKTTSGTSLEWFIAIK